LTSLKEKTISGVYWSIIENISKYGLQFVVGIVLARLLSPAEFGLVGMILIFIAISNSLVDAGFSQALIRKINASDYDFSTVFIFNFIFSLFVFWILFFSAGFISDFFEEPTLTLLLRVFAVNIIINALGMVQRTRLIRAIDFKTQTKISIIAGVLSGTIAIIFAYRGWGVWSLIIKTTTFNLINTLLLWVYSKWLPALIFKIESFKEMFAFGSKMVVAGLIDTVYRNIYYVVIGKYFSASDLGYFARAEQFTNMPSSNITTVIQRVSYPALSQIQDDKIKLKSAYKRIIKSTMLVSFVLMIGLAAVAEPLIHTLIGEKWEQSVVYLQLLCFVGMMYPIHGINLNMLKVVGRSDLFLKLEVIKKTMAVPVIVIGIFYGIKIMIAGMIINSFLAYFINSYWSGRFVNYPIKEQVLDILPSFLLALTIGVIVFSFGFVFSVSFPVLLAIQTFIGGLLFIVICEVTKLKAYVYLKEIVFSKLNKTKHG
jgi:teichuronic acid exporter